MNQPSIPSMGTLVIRGVLANVFQPSVLATATSKYALASGSSLHGKAIRAPEGSNCVNQQYLSDPSVQGTLYRPLPCLRDGSSSSALNPTSVFRTPGARKLSFATSF